MNPAAPPSLVLNAALLAVAAWLEEQGYRFTTVTPATQARVNARPGNEVARNLRDVFGWSRPFAPGLLPPEATEPLREAGLLQRTDDGLLRSRVRFSTLGSRLFAHSAFPTVEEDAVFFGPDTVRFVRVIQEELQRQPLAAGARIIDVGCGAGPGGILAALASPEPSLWLTDINRRALAFASANAAHAQCEAQLALSDLFEAVAGTFDLIVANPPYLNDAAQRQYRHGGGRWGEALSQRIVRDAMQRLAPGGRLVLYTGAAVVDGRDSLLDALRAELDGSGQRWNYRELDPDVFGEELEEPAYADVDRIAAVALVLQRH
jgi:SAM-dependent methyltransferase